MKPIIKEALEALLNEINREAAAIEARLQGIASKLGLNTWRDIEKLLTSEGMDNPELDMLWPEYLYLRGRLEELERRKRDPKGFRG